MNSTTAQVVQHHVEAMMSRDLDRIMEDYAEDAIFISNMAPAAICGTAALRQFWIQSLKIFTPELLKSIIVAQQVIERDIAYVVWSAGTAIPFATDTMVVRGNKIVAQTGTAQMAKPQ